MRVLVLIPARGGSKRLPGKNIRPLGGKPLIQWSIDTAKALPEACDVLVSTDDFETAELARRGGALVPWLRPSSLSDDQAKTADVALHALEWYETTQGGVDGLLLFQPTSPFRTLESVQRGVRLFRTDPSRAVVSFSPAATHPAWCFQIRGDMAEPFLSRDLLQARSQDLPPAYAINGAFYLVSPSQLRAHGSFFPPATRPLIMDGAEEAIDIDTPEDWFLAEHYLSEGKVRLNRGEAD